MMWALEYKEFYDFFDTLTLFMRTLTEAEQQEAVAFLCRKFPVIPVTIIKKKSLLFSLGLFNDQEMDQRWYAAGLRSGLASR